jgi:CRISPR-associated exonuclease Cas4
MSQELLLLSVTDVRQFVYCARVVYYTRFLELPRPVTYKMEEGRYQHQRSSELERRRSLRAYGLSEGDRPFSVRLYSQRLGLSGLLDMVIDTPSELIPVEFKHSTGQPGLNHKYQLTAYALLVEDRWHRPVRRGFVYRIPEKEAVEILITSNMRRHVHALLDEIRAMLRQGGRPRPTPYRQRCVDCEFRRLCGDVEAGD